jgi:hypothetical protein
MRNKGQLDIDERMALSAADIIRICIQSNRRPEWILNRKSSEMRNDHREQEGGAKAGQFVLH